MSRFGVGQADRLIDNSTQYLFSSSAPFTFRCLFGGGARVVPAEREPVGCSARHMHRSTHRCERTRTVGPRQTKV